MTVTPLTCLHISQSPPLIFVGCTNPARNLTKLESTLYLFLLARTMCQQLSAQDLRELKNTDIEDNGKEHVEYVETFDWLLGKH